MFMKLPQSTTKQQEQLNYHSSFYDDEEPEPITVLETNVTPAVATVEQMEQTIKPWRA